MTCQCKCKCQQEASGDTNRTPELCLACDLCDALGSDKHGLPYVAPAWKPVEPSVPISDAAKDKAIEIALDGLI
jgi:hypothetical protein